MKSLRASFELDTTVAQMVDRLPPEAKLQLVRRLESQTIGLRWRKIFKDIDSRLKKFPLAQKDVLAEITAYRKEKHA